MHEIDFTIDRFMDRDCAAAGELERKVFGEDAWSSRDYLESIRLDYVLYLAVHIKASIEPIGHGSVDFMGSHGSGLIGICGIRNMCGDGNITNVCVDPTFRRRGIATAMLNRLMEESREMGVRDFTLEVRHSNIPAIRLYEKMGFKSEGIRPGFYSHPTEDAYIMWKRRQ